MPGLSHDREQRDAHARTIEGNRAAAVATLLRIEAAELFELAELAIPWMTRQPDGAAGERDGDLGTHDGELPE
jgi:hypothetical protein